MFCIDWFSNRLVVSFSFYSCTCRVLFFFFWLFLRLIATATCCQWSVHLIFLLFICTTVRIRRTQLSAASSRRRLQRTSIYSLRAPKILFCSLSSYFIEINTTVEYFIDSVGRHFVPSADRPQLFLRASSPTETIYIFIKTITDFRTWYSSNFEVQTLYEQPPT